VQRQNGQFAGKQTALGGLGKRESGSQTPPKNSFAALAILTKPIAGKLVKEMGQGSISATIATRRANSIMDAV